MNFLTIAHKKTRTEQNEIHIRFFFSLSKTPKLRKIVKATNSCPLKREIFILITSTLKAYIAFGLCAGMLLYGFDIVPPAEARERAPNDKSL